MTLRDTVKPFAFLMTAGLIFLIGSCIVVHSNNSQTVTKSTDIVARVLMHRSKEFTFFVPVPDSQELQAKHVENWGADIQFFRDVPTDQDMFVTYHTDGNDNVKKIEIHLHSATDINGAGWNAGKFGSGMTTVVE